MPHSMDDHNKEDRALLRYSRHILMPEIGNEGQERIRQCKVLIVGVGGLGAPAVEYLAAAGVGQLTLIDHDEVDLSNLQRQVVHNEARLGMNKALSAQHFVESLNPSVRVRCYTEKLGDEQLLDAIRLSDVVLDCSDNFATRFQVNRLCARARKPLVSAAVIRFDGQLSVFDHRRDDAPCYRCLYEENGEEAINCTEAGVLASAPGVLGTLQATEALKLILGLPTLVGQLLVVDLLNTDFRKLSIQKDPHCPDCGKA